MKHFRICLAVFIAIITSSALSYGYICTQSRQLYAAIEKYCNIQTFTEEDIVTVKSIKNRFMDKKNMLQFFINKEHIHQLETDILLIENSILNNDAQSCREKSIDAMIVLELMQDYAVAID